MKERREGSGNNNLNYRRCAIAAINHNDTEIIMKVKVFYVLRIKEMKAGKA